MPRMDERLNELLGSQAQLVCISHDDASFIKFEYICAEMPDELPLNCEIQLLLTIDQRGMESIELTIYIERGILL